MKVVAYVLLAVALVLMVGGYLYMRSIPPVLIRHYTGEGMAPTDDQLRQYMHDLAREQRALRIIVAAMPCALVAVIFFAIGAAID